MLPNLTSLSQPPKHSTTKTLEKKLKKNWSILKFSYNNKKFPLILPLLINDKFVTDIKTKGNIFNKFFAEQCTMVFFQQVSMS